MVLVVVGLSCLIITTLQPRLEVIKVNHLHKIDLRQTTLHLAGLQCDAALRLSPPELELWDPGKAGATSTTTLDSCKAARPGSSGPSTGHYLSLARAVSAGPKMTKMKSPVRAGRGRRSCSLPGDLPTRYTQMNRPAEVKKAP